MTIGEWVDEAPVVIPRAIVPTGQLIAVFDEVTRNWPVLRARLGAGTLDGPHQHEYATLLEAAASLLREHADTTPMTGNPRSIPI